MGIRSVATAAFLAATGMVLPAAPAFADGPPVPAGCSFDRATGVETCTSTATVAITIGPLSSGGTVPISTVIGGFTGTQLCTATFGGSSGRTIYLQDATFTGTATTTTTTERHGLHGKVFSSVSTTSPVTLGRYISGAVMCGP